MAKRAGRDSKMGIKKKNINNQQQNRGHTGHTGHPFTQENNSKIKHIFEQKMPFMEERMSNDLFVDNGHRVYVKCSLTLYNNSIISIFDSFSCIKSMLKIEQYRNIRNFYRSEGMSTLSSVSSIILIVIQISFILF